MAEFRVAELFAGVGGFRIGLERSGWTVVWSNQWEPSTKAQHASDIYVARFGAEGHVNDDISRVLDRAEVGEVEIPDFELLVGGFPCQDYSVAKSLNQAAGIEGKKGVLWWQIHRLIQLKKPRFVLLENVDRLLKSPAGRRGRDFAIILACLSDLGYTVEWRVVNAADYGFPQRRRRVFIVAHQLRESAFLGQGNDWVHREGALARALHVRQRRRSQSALQIPDLTIAGDVLDISDGFGLWSTVMPFLNAGVMSDRRIWTCSVEPNFNGRCLTLGDILVADEQVAPEFFIPEEQLPTWSYLKGAKREPRRDKRTGHEYHYTEGAIAFPEPLDQPSRTILTGEGGATPSRFKHVVRTRMGHRRLTPIELERLNGFPDDWTAHPGVTDGRRAFLMGNALVVGVVEKIGLALRRLEGTPKRASAAELQDKLAHQTVAV